ncbi:MAG TPA: type II toxin-antitoxin system RelE/ParE family toxin [Isosphaeraceae bacterium]
MQPAADRAVDRIAKADRKAAAKIDRVILDLAQDPRHHGVEKMSGLGDIYRVRSGDYRILFSIDDERRVVTIESIGNRRDIYRGL